MKRARDISTAILAASTAIYVLVEYARPWVVDAIYKEDYKRLTLECDRAMHDEIVLRERGAGTNADQLLAISADIGLLSCHEYDKLRKLLLTNGVSEETLALHGLEALDIEMIPVSEMADPHRMPRF